MVPPASPDMIREFHAFFIKFGYYYARKLGEEEGKAALPQRLSGYPKN
jgi:hypothetical protein